MERKMKRPAYAIGLTIVMVVATAVVSHSQEAKSPNQKRLSSNQALMRDKLKHMNGVLEGLTMGNFDEVQKSAELLGMISKATSWHVSDPSPRYQRLSKNFQEQSADMERHAKEKNVDAVTLDLVRMNVTCTHCHEHMREK
jgi:hypothetical protein